jgi:hypothetical protein
METPIEPFNDWEMVENLADLADLVAEGFFPMPVGLAASLAGITRQAMESRVERGTMKGLRVNGQKCLAVPDDRCELCNYLEKRI